MPKIFKTSIVNFPYPKEEYAGFTEKVWPVIESLEGFLDHDEAFVLYYLAKTIRPTKPFSSNIVEVGSFKGKSTVALALGVKDNPGLGIKVHAVDPFLGVPQENLKGCFEDFMANIKKAKVADYVNVIGKPSAEAAREWPTDKEITFLFIDGNHRFEFVEEDHALWSRHVNDSNGIVAFHDLYMTGVYEAVVKEFLPRQCYYKYSMVLRPDDLNNGILFGYRGYYRLKILHKVERFFVSVWLRTGGHVMFIRAFYAVFGTGMRSLKKLRQLLQGDSKK